MSRILKNKDFLQLLCTGNKKLKKTLIQNGTPDQIKSICEIILNLLRGNIKLTDEELDKLKKKKKILRQLSKKNQSSKKRKILIQKGGFLQFLIPALISGLATIVSSAIEKQ